MPYHVKCPLVQKAPAGEMSSTNLYLQPYDIHFSVACFIVNDTKTLFQQCHVGY